MGQLTVEDVRRIAKILNVPLLEERLQTITASLNQTVDILKPLSKQPLPKELEPTTYLAYLSGRLKKPEDL